MFDVEAAIETRIAERGVDTAFEKLQEEGKQHVSIQDRSIHGLRAIEIAEKNLEQREDDFEYTRLAEGYFLTGDFEKAYYTTRDETKKAEYWNYLNASEVQCVCPEVKVGRTSLSPRFVKEKFPGKQISYCTTCHSYNVENTS